MLRSALRSSAASPSSRLSRSAVLSARSAASKRLSSVATSPCRRYAWARLADAPLGASSAISSSTICCCRPRRPSVSHSRSCWSSRSDERVRAGVVVGQVRDPAPDALERRQRIGELAQRCRALGRSPAVVDRLAPRLGVCKVMGEQGRQVGPAIRVTPLDGPSHHLVQRAPLPFEQAVVGDLLRQHVPEAVRGLGQDGGLLDQPRAFEPLERGRRIGARSQHLAEQDAPELAPDHRGDAEHIPRIPIEAIEPGANDGLHRIRQPQHFDAAGRHRFAVVRRHRVFLEQRAAHLLEEERVAARPFVHTRGQRVRHPIDAQHGPHDRRRGIARERRELNARGAICTPGERARLRPARHDDHQRMRVDNLEQACAARRATPRRPSASLRAARASWPAAPARRRSRSAPRAAPP